jgi:hypothetical protein
MSRNLMIQKTISELKTSEKSSQLPFCLTQKEVKYVYENTVNYSDKPLELKQNLNKNI